MGSWASQWIRKIVLTHSIHSDQYLLYIGSKRPAFAGRLSILLFYYLAQERGAPVKKQSSSSNNMYHMHTMKSNMHPYSQ